LGFWGWCSRSAGLLKKKTPKRISYLGGGGPRGAASKGEEAKKKNKIRRGVIILGEYHHCEPPGKKKKKGIMAGCKSKTVLFLRRKGLSFGKKQKRGKNTSRSVPGPGVGNQLGGRTPRRVAGRELSFFWDGGGLEYTQRFAKKGCSP